MNKDYIKTIRKKIGRDMLLICGASVIVHSGQKVLLQKRRDSGLWAIHGGCVEIGEKVEEAAKRELFEETGLTANRLNFFDYMSGNDMFHTYPNGDQICVIDIIFTCDDFSGTPAESTEETFALEWFDIKKLPGQLHPMDIKILDEFIAAYNRKEDLSRTIYELEYTVANRKVKDVQNIFTDDFREFGKSGRIFTKADYIKDWESDRKDYGIEITDFKITDIDTSTVIATYISLYENEKALRSSVWTFTGGTWRMAFHQGTKR